MADAVSGKQLVAVAFGPNYSTVSGKQNVATASIVGLRSISMFDMSNVDNSSGGWALQVGVQRSDTEGFPSPPSILLAQPGAWRFRWQVSPGTQTISCYCKQGINLAPFPSMVVRADASLGVSLDVTGTSAGGTGWVKIGPLTVVCTSPGVLWVELRANYAGQDSSGANPLGPWYPCYFDNIDI
jgi:hypothetical protein